MDERVLTLGLMAMKDQINSEVGTEPNCPFCQTPRVSRSDYIRCNPCGINWLDSERHLSEYLDRNPAAARTGTRIPRSAATSKVGAELTSPDEVLA